MGNLNVRQYDRQNSGLRSTSVEEIRGEREDLEEEIVVTNNNSNTTQQNTTTNR